LSQEQINNIYKIIPVLSLVLCFVGVVHLLWTNGDTINGQTVATNIGTEDKPNESTTESLTESQLKNDLNTSGKDESNRKKPQEAPPLKNQYKKQNEITEPSMRPWGVAVTDSGIICVSDRKTNSLILFNDKGKLLTTSIKANKTNDNGEQNIKTDNNKKTGNLIEPTGIACKDGLIYVADSGNNRIAVFNETAKFLFAFGKEGTNKGEFTRPVGICCAKDGRILVAQVDNSSIQIFSKEGSFIKKYSGDEIKMNSLWDIASLDNGNFAISSALGGLTVYSEDFKPLYSLGNRGSGQGNYLFTTGVAVDNKGRILVCAKTQGKIMVINKPVKGYDRGITEGEIYSLAGKNCGPLPAPVIAATGTKTAKKLVNEYRKKIISYPMDVAVSKDGVIVIAERGNGRILFFEEITGK